MNDNKKIIRLDENDKIVIEDNNSVTTIKGTTSKIEGTYEISDYDVGRLLVLINDNTILKEVHTHCMFGSIYSNPNTSIITSDEAVSVVSKEYDKLDKKYKELNDRHTTMEEKYDNLLKKVKKHNKYSLFNKIEIN